MSSEDTSPVSVSTWKPNEVIRGHQRSSEAIRGHQRPSEAAGVTQDKNETTIRVVVATRVVVARRGMVADHGHPLQRRATRQKRPRGRAVLGAPLEIGATWRAVLGASIEIGAT